MAELKRPDLVFDRGCPDPGERRVALPAPLPEIGDDFDWSLRDYDSFRDAMLEELQVRFPERRRWTTADLEVVLVELYAAALDQLSDMADRVAAEAYLETARRPESVYNWLSFIGLELENTERMSREALLEHWRDNPHAMEAIRRNGPGTIRTQKRMASLADYADRLEEHPLMQRAQANRRWGGAWSVVWVTVSLWNDNQLQDLVAPDGQPVVPREQKEATDEFHSQRGLLLPQWDPIETFRDVLDVFVAPFRSIGQEVFLDDVDPVGIDLAFCVRVGRDYFRSEVLREARRVLGRGPGGFFEPGRLRFGEDLHVSDFYQALMSLNGVTNVDVLVFKKVGSLYPNRADVGEIQLALGEFAVCDNDSTRRERGILKIELIGGRRG